jgi:hypothetical protein
MDIRDCLRALALAYFSCNGRRPRRKLATERDQAEFSRMLSRATRNVINAENRLLFSHTKGAILSMDVTYQVIVLGTFYLF